MVAVFKTRQSLKVVMEQPQGTTSCHLSGQTENGYARWSTSSDTSSSDPHRDDDESDDCEEGEHILLIHQTSCEEEKEENGTEYLCLQRCCNKNDKEENYYSTKEEPLRGLWNRPLLPQGPWKIAKDQVLLDAKGVNLFKFFLVSVASILLVHFYGILVVSVQDSSSGIFSATDESHTNYDDCSQYIPEC